MARTAVAVAGLGKRYRIASPQSRHDTARAALSYALSSPIRSLARGGDALNEKNDFWALRHVDFEVMHGEVLGIVGRNGAGKSTLLKVLSRITKPTEGRAQIHGRVGSLLEVGTGFHPELSGRENVYLNGSILGMDRAYIGRRFDEIVAFSGVGKFIDTPVKRYSSGMYLRLAFSVAAHLEPEVLIVDEVLAVGDADFQKKCIGKISEVAGEGRTVLFVSHNLGAVARLCKNALLLAQGRATDIGPAAAVVRRYLSSGPAIAVERYWETPEGPGDGTARMRSVRVLQFQRTAIAPVDMERPFSIEVDFDAESPSEELNIGIMLSDAEGQVMFHSTQSLNGDSCATTVAGRYRVACAFPADALNAGRYSVSVIADEPFKRMVFSESDVLRFEVESNCRHMGRYPAGSYQGHISPRLATWSRVFVGPPRGTP